MSTTAEFLEIGELTLADRLGNSVGDKRLRGGATRAEMGFRREGMGCNGDVGRKE
jgi:hypothetical protein